MKNEYRGLYFEAYSWDELSNKEQQILINNIVELDYRMFKDTEWMNIMESAFDASNVPAQMPG